MTSRYIWVQTGIPPKCRPSQWQKRGFQASADAFVSDFYKPMPQPKKRDWNYVVGVSTKWHGAYLKFVARYACPGPNALSPFFDHEFARLGYFRPEAWSLWARRHNDEWIVLGHQLTLEECFSEMRNNPWFQIW